MANTQHATSTSSQASRKRVRQLEALAPLRASVLLVAFAIIVTGFCAAPLWFWWRSGPLNALADHVRWKRRRPRVRGDICMVVFVVFLFDTVLDLLNPGAPTAMQLSVSLGGAALLISQALQANRILRRVAEHHSVGVSSVVAALLTPFSPIYLQWKINVIVARGADVPHLRPERPDNEQPG